ncbi:hypothetical protein VL10_24055 [Leclercia adecarboxylata]|nr:hypothetical protein VL10_24055 [Leclercia adecarboxylata]KMN66751.1 hypothetical protein VK95_04495 [Leclercia sp. LK8]
MPSFLFEPHLLFFALLRPLGLCVMFPILSSKNLGAGMIRNALVLAMAIPVLPLFLNPRFIHTVDTLSVGGIFLELFIGILIGFTMALPFWALDSAGFIVDTIRGASMGSVLNPSLGEAASMTGILFVQLFVALFFMHGGLHHVLSILYKSYQIIPPGTIVIPGERWLDLLFIQWEAAFAMGVSFVLPGIIVMVLTDLAIGLINRSAQQLNVFFLAMPVKSALAILMLITSLMFNYNVLFIHVDTLLHTLDTMLAEMPP